jgi:hypothetical protein
MKPEEFVRKVERLERDAKARPEAYKFKVFLCALLGYAYIHYPFPVPPWFDLLFVPISLTEEKKPLPCLLN